MKQTRAGAKAVSQLFRGIVPLVLALVVIPILILAVIGFVSLILEGRLWWFAVVMTISSLLVAIPYYWRGRQQRAEKQALEALPGYEVKPSGQWSEFDHKAWLELNQRIDELLEIDSQWAAMRAHSLQLVADAAGYYYPDKADKALAFTAPEFLLMVEEISRRYRQFLLNHVPFAEKIRVKTLFKGYAQKEKIEVAKQAYHIYRVFRAMTPAGLVAEARGQILGRIFDDVSVEVQSQLKRVLLQEVAAVAIDLYSGRFTARESELAESRIAALDRDRFAADIDPLRIAVIGQVSAGKSSLINAITRSMVAEVNALPSTDAVVVHRCQLEGTDLLHLVDLPGIDGKPETSKLLLEQIFNSDMVLWVLKANQPGRRLDIELKRQLDVLYSEEQNRGRKKPLILALVNQVDRLQPAQEWHPPYNLEQPDSAKAEVIRAALEYNREQLKPDAIMAVAAVEGKVNYNIDQIADYLLHHYEDGVNTQLNRRRMEQDSVALSQQVKRLYRLVERAFRELTE